IVDLDEIDVASLDEPLQIGVGATVVVRDAHIADAARGLPVAQGCQVRVRVLEVVHLHEVEALDAQLLHRVLHLANARLLATGPHLGRDEELRAHSQLGRELPRHRFRQSVHRRAVDDAASKLDEDLDLILCLRLLGGVASDVEYLPGAEADCGNRFSRLGNAALDYRAASCVGRHQHGSYGNGAGHEEGAPGGVPVRHRLIVEDGALPRNECPLDGATRASHYRGPDIPSRRRDSMRRRTFLATMGTAAAAMAGPPLLGRAAEKGPIRIGYFGPLTGNFSQPGKDMTDGFTLFWEEVGNKVAGREVKIIVEDSDPEPASALTKV